MTSTAQPARHVLAVATGGAVILLASVILWASELSRAVGAAAAAFAVALLGAVAFARGRGRWPARPWQLLFGTLAVAAIAYGIWLLVDAWSHPPVAV